MRLVKIEQKGAKVYLDGIEIQDAKKYKKDWSSFDKAFIEDIRDTTKRLIVYWNYEANKVEFEAWLKIENNKITCTMTA